MKPNIFFLNLDSIRSDKFTGETKTAITPNLDKLLKKGTYFSQCVSSGDGTVISLNALFNAQFPFRIGTRAETLIFKNNNCFEILKKSGYKIYGFTPNFFAFTKFLNFCENENAGFRHIRQRNKVELEGILDGVGKKMIELLDSNQMKEPWFFYIHAEDLHFPYAVPKEFDSEKFGENPYERILSALDQWIGNILEKIDTSNTLIIISGDHGHLIPFENKGTRDFEPEFKTGLNMGKKLMPHSTHKIGAKMFVGLRNKIRDSRLKKANEGLTPYQKRSRLPHFRLSLFDEVIRIPLLFIAKNIPEDKQLSQQISNVDIFPTILDILEFSDNSQRDGRSLVPYFKGDNMEEREVYLHTIPYVEKSVDDKVGIRTSKYKYFRYARESSEKINLYDLSKDPQENNNIASENPAIVKEMEAILEGLTKNATIESMDDVDDKRLERIQDELRLLGYKKT